MGSSPGTAAKSGRPVLSTLFFDNPMKTFCIHDVAEACRLAMPEVRVRLPLDALRSRVEVGSFPDRSFAMNETKRRVGKPGNPPALGAGDRQFKSDHADCIAVELVLVRAGGC